MYYKDKEVKVISTYEVNGVSWVLIENSKNQLLVVQERDLKNDKG